MMRHRTPLFTLLFASVLFASGVPIEDMSRSTLGIEYKGMVAGQTITEAAVPSLFKAHYAMLRYAPLPYLLVSLGIGGTKFSTDEYDSTRFKGHAGFSAACGVHGYSPSIVNLLMITAGAEAYLLNSRQDGYQYTAGLMNPIVGVRFLIGGIFDIEAGAKGHILYGQMEGPQTKSTTVFSNNNNLRGYLAATLHSNNGGAYTTFTFDASPKANSDQFNGLNEASFSVQIGLLLSQERFNSKSDDKKKKGDSFRGYDKMKEKQDKMADEMRKRN